MEVKSVIFAMLILSIVSVSFFIAFGLPNRNYIPQENLNELEGLGKNYVQESNPSFLGQVFFYISSFLAIMKTAFNFATIGLKAMIFDLGTIYGIPYTIIALISGVVTFIVSVYVIERLRGS